MLNRKRFFVVHGVDAATWAKRYDLEQYTCPCSECERPLTTSIPFASGQLRGLVAPKCECGNESTPYCVVTADPRLGDTLEVMARQGAQRRATRGHKHET